MDVVWRRILARHGASVEIEQLIDASVEGVTGSE
jgi:hypothetical protein